MIGNVLHSEGGGGIRREGQALTPHHSSLQRVKEKGRFLGSSNSKFSLAGKKKKNQHYFKFPTLRTKDAGRGGEPLLPLVQFLPNQLLPTSFFCVRLHFLFHRSAKDLPDAHAPMAVLLLLLKRLSSTE